MAASQEVMIPSQSLDPVNELLLLERVFLRLGNADTDDQLENCISKFLTPVLLKLASPHEQVRTKVMELLVHINRRLRCRSEIQLPMTALVSQYQDPKATHFVINFTIIYITMGFPRLTTEAKIELIPKLLSSLTSRPQTHQDEILLLVMPILGELGNKSSSLNLKEHPEQAKLLVRIALDLLLLPYGALPASKNSSQDFPVPPGLSSHAYKRLTDKSSITAEQLEKTKQSIVKFLTSDALDDGETLLPLIVAAADSRFSVANVANAGLGKVVSSVDWSSAAVCTPLYTLFLGTTAPRKLPQAHIRTPACTRIRLKLLQYINKAMRDGIVFPYCIQVIFAALFATNTNPRLKTLSLNFTFNLIQSGDLAKLKSVAPVLLGGLLKLTRTEDEWTHHAQAFTCIGRLIAKAPSAITKRFEILEELFNKMPSATPELRMAIREALLAMADSFKVASSIKSPLQGPEPMDVTSSTENLNVVEKMDIDSASSSKEDISNLSDENLDETHLGLVVALLEKHLENEDVMVRFVATKYASVLFPKNHIPSKYLLLLVSGDVKDEVKFEALKALYGSTRQSEIEDAVQNVIPVSSEVHLIKADDNKKEKESKVEEESRKLPSFDNMVEYIWGKINKRKENSNLKQRFVVGNHVLPFSPAVYYEILRYLRMCLNNDAGIKDGLPHPSSSSPILSEYLNTRILTSDSLIHYLQMIKILLVACPDIMPFTCLLDIVGCAPQKMAPQFVDQLAFLKTHFVNTIRSDIRETASIIYAIILATTGSKSDIENTLEDLLNRSKSEKNLESQCGYIFTLSNLLERCIVLHKQKKLTIYPADFNIQEWDILKNTIEFLVECLSNPQSMIVNSACINLALLGKVQSLPLANGTKGETVDKPTKLSLVDNLFAVLKNAKFTVKIKERATNTLGVICVGEPFPHSKYIIEGFLEMAKESKDFEIHLQIGESLIYCIDGVNSYDNRDFWTERLPKEKGIINNNHALEENDKILDWLLDQLLNFVKIPHPNSRQASCVWLLSLVKNCSDRTPVRTRLSAIQDAFMEFLSENSDIVQDVASKGLSLVYQSSNESDKKDLVDKLIEQLAGGKRQVAQVTQDTKLFEEGQLGKTPTGANLTTYKELCSFASDLNQPDLIYKFMHLANHNAIWNSKKGAAFGFHSIAQQAGSQLAEHLPKIVPRLYRYRFDPTPKIQNSMSSIWSALVPETQKTVEKYRMEILKDILQNLTANQWRIRTSCCLALSELVRVTKNFYDFNNSLDEIWSKLFRVMDDVHEGTRTAAFNATTVLSKLCVKAADVVQGKAGKELVAVILPVLLNTGITNTVSEVRAISLQTVSKMVTSAGATLKPFLPQLIPALLQATGDLESSKLSYLSTMLGGKQQSQEVVDSVRAQAAKSHYTMETVAKCVPYADYSTVEQMLPNVLDLVKSPQLGVKVGCTHLFILLTQQLGKELTPVAGKMMSSLVNCLLDRNTAVRKHSADALGYVVGVAKESSLEKLIAKLTTWYKERDDDAVRSAIALTLHAISSHHNELLKEKSHLVIPLLFFAMHAQKNPETTSTVELYEEIWSDVSPGKEQGIRTHLNEIFECLKEAIDSPSWTMKAQAANSISTIATEMKTGLGNKREELIKLLLEALKGRTWEGKEKIVQALSNLCKCADETETLDASLSEVVIDNILRECGKQDLVYKTHCLTALGDCLETLHKDRFEEVYNILHDTLTKDVSSIEKDSDNDDSNEEVSKKTQQLITLKEVSYETLGKAWPENKATQEKYQKVFATHCADHITKNTKAVQVAILTALKLYLEKLILVNLNSGNSGNGDKMDVDGSPEDLQFITKSVVSVLDYAFGVTKHTRLRKEAMNILDILGKKLKEGKIEEYKSLKNLYNKYEAELGKDTAPEVRSRLVHIKITFQD